MPIPDFDENGFLPPGVHPCRLEEVQERFGRARVNFQRPELFAKLHEYVKEAKSAGIIKAIVLDGSFVTDKAVPNDIDMVVVLEEGYKRPAQVPPFQYNAISKLSVRKRYRFDIVPAEENSADYEDAVAFFQQIRGPEDVHKGVLRIEL